MVMNWCHYKLIRYRNICNTGYKTLFSDQNFINSGNAKLLQKLKLGFERAITRKKLIKSVNGKTKLIPRLPN